MAKLCTELQPATVPHTAGISIGHCIMYVIYARFSEAPFHEMISLVELFALTELKYDLVYIYICLLVFVTLLVSVFNRLAILQMIY